MNAKTNTQNEETTDNYRYIKICNSHIKEGKNKVREEVFARLKSILDEKGGKEELFTRLKSTSDDRGKRQVGVEKTRYLKEFRSVQDIGRNFIILKSGNGIILEKYDGTRLDLKEFLNLRGNFIASDKYGYFSTPNSSISDYHYPTDDTKSMYFLVSLFHEIGHEYWKKRLIQTISGTKKYMLGRVLSILSPKKSKKIEIGKNLKTGLKRISRIKTLIKKSEKLVLLEEEIGAWKISLEILKEIDRRGFRMEALYNPEELETYIELCLLGYRWFDKHKKSDFGKKLSVSKYKKILDKK